MIDLKNSAIVNQVIEVVQKQGIKETAGLREQIERAIERAIETKSDELKKPIVIDAGEGKKIDFMIQKEKLEVSVEQPGLFYGTNRTKVCKIEEAGLHQFRLNSIERKDPQHAKAQGMRRNNTVTKIPGQGRGAVQANNDLLFSYSGGTKGVRPKGQNKDSFPDLLKKMQDELKEAQVKFEQGRAQERYSSLNNPVDDIRDNIRSSQTTAILDDIKSGIVIMKPKGADSKETAKKIDSLMAAFDKSADAYLKNGGSITRSDLVDFLNKNGVGSTYGKKAFNTVFTPAKGVDGNMKIFKFEGNNRSLVSQFGKLAKLQVISEESIERAQAQSQFLGLLNNR